MKHIKTTKRLVVLSYFVEGMDSSWHKIVRVLNWHLAGGSFGDAARSTRCLTGDVNLRVNMEHEKPLIHCSECGKLTDPTHIAVGGSRGEERLILHLCPKCTRRTREVCL